MKCLGYMHGCMCPDCVMRGNRVRRLHEKWSSECITFAEGCGCSECLKVDRQVREAIARQKQRGVAPC